MGGSLIIRILLGPLFSETFLYSLNVGTAGFDSSTAVLGDLGLDSYLEVLG